MIGYNRRRQESRFEAPSCLAPPLLHSVDDFSFVDNMQGVHPDINDEVGLGDGYSGTFRWKASKILPSLPSPKENLVLSTGSINLQQGWKEFFESRAKLSEARPRDMVEFALSDLSIVDCLSFPISVVSALKDECFGLDWSKTYEKLSILCIGCSSKAEERVLMETRSFLELTYGLPRVVELDLWLIGPEISETKVAVQQHKFASANEKESLATTFRASVFKGTVSSFFRSYPHYLAKESVIIGYNCGFGNFENPLPRRYDLLLSWLPDLQFLSSTQLPMCFFCANDYADIVGEVTVMNLLGAYFLSLPKENSFSFASTMVPPNAESQGEYARGNSFYYIVKGSDRNRRHPALKGGSKISSDILATMIPLLSKSSMQQQLRQINVRQGGSLPLVVHTPAPSAMTPAPEPVKPATASASVEAATTVLPVPVVSVTSTLPPAPATVQDHASSLASVSNPPSATSATTETSDNNPIGCELAGADEVDGFKLCQYAENGALVVELTTSESSPVDLRTLDLNLHSSGGHLMISYASSVNDRLSMKVELSQRVLVDGAPPKAKYSRKSNTLKVLMKIA